MSGELKVLKETLTEAYHIAHRNMMGQFEEIFKNPTSIEIRKLPGMTEVGEVKGLLTPDGDLFVWSISDASNHEYIDRLVVGARTDSLRVLFTVRKNKLIYYTHPVARHLSNDEITKWVMKYEERFRRAFGNSFKFELENN